MKWVCVLVLAGVLARPDASAQSLRVYSEFVQLSERGEVIAPENPREILSPAVARNAVSSWQVVVLASPGKKFALHVGQNPENFAGVSAYRRHGETLEPVLLPYQGDGPSIFWLDLHVAPGALVGRVKIEPQVLIDEDWVIYPMEVRVTAAEVPGNAAMNDGDAEPIQVMRKHLCGAGAAKTGVLAGLTAARLRYRNALQDVALVGSLSQEQRLELTKRLDGCGFTGSLNPEAYLRVRDYLLNTPPGK